MSTTTETSETTTNTEERLFAPAPKPRHPIIEIVQFALIALLIVLPIRMFIAQPFIVSGASMEETFHTGEYLIVDQVTYRFHEPTRGDVIIFRYPRDPSKFFIKRIIGLPGDTITIDGSTVTIFNDTYPEGVELTESYIKSMEPNTVQTETLGDREYFVMGDNRDQSSDSRVWGVLQEENIIGRALVRLFPVNDVEILPGFVRYNDEGDIINE
jgi:signal peptidase I